MLYVDMRREVQLLRRERERVEQSQFCDEGVRQAFFALERQLYLAAERQEEVSRQTSP